MQKMIIFLMTLFFCQGILAQENPNTFPNDFLGIYKGRLQIFNVGQEMKEIPMEFHLTKTDTLNRYNYILIYDGKPRNYTLVVKDREKGFYEIDENNGIILQTKFEQNILFSFFQVNQNFLSTRIAFQGDKIDFEILMTKTSDSMETGMEMALEIFSFPISVVQKVVLARENP